MKELYIVVIIFPGLQMKKLKFKKFNLIKVIQPLDVGIPSHIWDDMSSDITFSEVRKWYFWSDFFEIKTITVASKPLL